LGRTREESEAMGAEVITRIVHVDDQDALRAMNKDAEALKEGETLQGRFRFQHANGNWHWMSRLVVPFRRDETGAVIEVLGVIRDITDVVNAEEQMFHGALHDALTGLPNRSLLMDRLEAALIRSSRDGREIAILYCDLDGFKNVNDTAGHVAGDAVLVETARRLLSAVREGDTVARVGGDEFVVVVEPWNRGTGPRTGVEFSVEVAERALRAIVRPFLVNGVEHDVSVSVGVAHSSIITSYGTIAERAAKGIEEADAAMYEAKRKGKNRIEVFDDTSHTSS
jgi:diguanylate cyclase (GGDEF)-like protein/PAS domain S-box-containing protein